jgi:hypothetical protein
VAKLKRNFIAKSPIRRVIGLSELFSFCGTWLTRRGKRFTSLATIIAGGAAIADILGDNIFSYQLPVNKFEMAIVPLIAAAATFGLGGAMSYVAKLMCGADRAAAEANSVCEIREVKQMPDATRKQAEDLWDRVGKYESVLVNGEGACQDEIEMLADCRSKLRSAIDGLPDKCLARHGVDLDNRDEEIDKLVRHIEIAGPLSSGIECSKQGFVESVVFALNEAMPHMEQKNRIGFDLSQIESYRNWEVFESKLSKEYSSNRFLRGVSKKAGFSFLTSLEIKAKGFGDEILKNLTRNKMYMMAGKGMNALNSRLDTNAFDAQPFIWMTDALARQIENAYGGDVLNLVDSHRDSIRKQIFWDSAGVRRHIFDCFDADYLRALRLRLAFDVEYAAGLLDQKPIGDIAEISDLVGREILSDKVLDEYQQAAASSLDESKGLISGLDDITARAVRIEHYTAGWSIEKGVKVQWPAEKVAQYSDELVQLRIHEYLAREQIVAHCQLIEQLNIKHKCESMNSVISSL